ncbi:hypothetical protein [Paenibacillus aestuarii]|uniref:Uncharacterized protein n=1 Tax=Paenibacillus aestuarii TaxID=516965 RepID=A0ABW0KHE9_9BACL|nr:hypothetical protein [Paenibacillus aestuarii]
MNEDLLNAISALLDQKLGEKLEPMNESIHRLEGKVDQLEEKLEHFKGRFERLEVKVDLYTHWV